MLKVANAGEARGLPRNPAMVDQSRPERPDAEPVEAGTNLMRGYGLLPDQANHGDRGDGWEQHVGNNVVSEATGDDYQEELES